MQTLRFKIPIAPAGKEEARRSIGGAVYKPKKTRDLMKEVADFVCRAYRGPALDGPLRILVMTHKQRPKALKKGTIFAPVKPDYDNVGKLLGDALEGVLWTNDSRIVDGRVIKLFAPAGEAPWVDLLVAQIKEETFEPVAEAYFECMTGKACLRCG